MIETFLESSFRALRSLFTPGMFRLFVLSVILTIAVLFAFVGFSSAFFAWLAQQLEDRSLAEYLPWLGSVGSILIAWMLFPGIMPIIVNFFDDRIARLIEQSDYPAAPPATAQRFWPELWHDTRFSIMVILLNLLALPFYLFPVLGQLLFYALNGYLLGREFFVMAARRHIPISTAELLRKRHRRPILIAGIAITVLATIPILNLFAPFWGIALMVHLYHRVSATPRSDIFAP